MSDAEIFEQVKAILADKFEVDPGSIALASNVFDDLGLDSIDAVDLAIKIQEITGKRVQPQAFKNIRTVSDIVTAVRELLAT